MSFRRIMSLVAMAFLWTGSQIPVYIFGGIPPYIYRDIGGTDRWIWFVLANLLALAAVCPFVGSLSDLMGRRYVAVMGASLIILGMIVSSTAHSMNVFIGKQRLFACSFRPRPDALTDINHVQAVWQLLALAQASTN